MIQMYTGYFDNCSKYKELGLVPISIAISTPSFITEPRYTRLAPSLYLLYEYKYGKHRGDVAYYTERFKKEILGKFNQPADAVRELCQLAGTTHDRIILMCYEKPGQFCHRHLVAKWIGKQFCNEINLATFACRRRIV